MIGTILYWVFVVAFMPLALATAIVIACLGLAALAKIFELLRDGYRKGVTQQPAKRKDPQ